MNIFRHKTLFAFLLILSSFGFSNAQTANTKVSTSSQASSTQKTKKEFYLVADVNFIKVSTTTQESKNIVSFTIKNSLGTASNISYGLVYRDKKGQVLATIPGGSILNLKEKESKVLSIVYSLLSLPVDGFVTLSAFNDRGILLAQNPVDSFSKIQNVNTCSLDKEEVSCKTKNLSNLSVNLVEGSPFVKTDNNLALTSQKSTAHKLLVSSLLKNTHQSRYFIVATLSDVSTNSVLASYVFEKEISNRVSILNFNPKITDGNIFSGVLLTSIPRNASSSLSLKLSLTDNSGKLCGQTESALTKPAITIKSNVSCGEGKALLTLLDNGKVVDEATYPFMAPYSPKVNNNSDDSLYDENARLAVYILLILVVGIGALYGVRRMKGGVGQVVVGAIILFSIISFGSSHVNAATAYVDGNAECLQIGSGNVTDFVDPCLSMSGTVTFSNPASPNSYNSLSYSLLSFVTMDNLSCNGNPCSPSDVYGTPSGISMPSSIGTYTYQSGFGLNGGLSCSARGGASHCVIAMTAFPDSSISISVSAPASVQVYFQ